MSGEAPKEAILCVDDEAIILMHLVMVLKGRYGPRFLYEIAANADSAMKKIDALVEAGTTIIAVVSDWLMPGITGDAFLRAVHAKYPGIKAIMVSGRIDSEGIDAIKEETGLVGFLPKPVNPAELCALIDSIVG